MVLEGRECGVGRGTGGCITRMMGGGARVTICTCSEDRCNYAQVEGVKYEGHGVDDLLWAVMGLLTS